MLSRIFFILFLISVSSANATPDEKQSTQAVLAQTQERLQKLENDLNGYQQKTQISLEASDKRLSDFTVQFGAQATNQGTHATWMGNIVAITGLLITVIVAFAGWFTYVNATARAKAEAKKAAKKWFDDKAKHLQEEVIKLVNEAEAGRVKIADDIGKFGNEAQVARDKLTAALLVSIPQPGDTNPIEQAEDPSAEKIIKSASDDLKDKPESDFSANDHYIRGVSLYKSGKLESALDSFDAAIRLSANAPATEHALYFLLRGITLGQQGKLDEAIATYDEIDRRFAQNAEFDVRERVAGALNNKGIMLGQQGKLEEEIAVYDEINKRFSKDVTPGVRERVAGVLNNKGVVLGKLGKSDEAIAVYDEITNRFSQDTAPGVRERVASALNNKGAELGKHGKPDEAITVYDEIDSRYSQDMTFGVRERVVGALNNKGIMLDRQNKHDEAIAVYDEINSRFGQDIAPSVRGHVAGAVMNKALVLGRQKKYDKAIMIYNEIEQRFGQDVTPAVHKQVIAALNGLAFTKIILAKKQWQNKTQRSMLLGAAIPVLKHALVTCSEENRAMVLGNLGYAEFLLGEHDGIVATRECLKLGGTKSLDEQRADAKLHRVEPEDSVYERLLDTLWGELQDDASGQA